MKTKSVKNKGWNAPKWVFFFFLVTILCLFLQFSYLSLSPVIYGKNMDDFAKKRNTVSTTLYANRGTIYDKDGNILALNVSSYTVIAYLSANRTGSSTTPLHVVDKEKTAKELAPILNMTEEYLLKLLSSDAYQVELGPGGRGITELTKEEIKALNLPGIDFVETHKRYYPNGDFASYIIGYAKEYETVDSSNQSSYNIVGELGIESKYDDLLKGTDGSLTYQRDSYGYKIPDTKEDRVDAANGDNIYLTIDSNIQRFIEEAIKDVEEAYGPEWLQLTAVNAKTGEIYGTGSIPSFDPNIKNITNYENPLTSYIYEPGSTMKIFTYMCAMEKGTYNGNATFSSGNISIGDDVISDWNKKGWGTISYDKGFEYSSNVGVVNLLQTAIDKTDLRSCLEKYGFGQKTNIELPREMVGQINFNYPIEVATAGFGQGITTTAIQQIQALTMLANNGKIVKPHIVEKIVNTNTNEVVYQSKTETSDQIVSPDTINKLKSLMHNVVYGTDEGTTGRGYKVSGVNLIAKTGTAQIYDTTTNKYLTGTNDYIYSVATLFPEEDPEIIVYAAMKKPKWGTTSGLYKAVTYVINNVSKYLNINSNSEEANVLELYDIGSYTNKKVTDVSKELSDNDLTPVIIGSGDKVISQSPVSGTTLIKGDKVFLLTNINDYKMINMTGWSRNEVIAFSKITGIEYEINGFGYVTEQNIKVDTLLNSDSTLTVTLKEKYDLQS